MSRMTRLLMLLALLMLVVPLGTASGQAGDAPAPAEEKGEENIPLATARLVADLVEPMRAIAHARGNHFVVDSVPPLGSPSEEANSLDMFLAALATCPMFIYETASMENNIPMERLQVAVEADLAPQGVRDGSVNPRIRQFRIFIDMQGPTGEEAEFLRSELQARCPIYTTLVRAAPIDVVHVGMDMGVILEVDFTYDLEDDAYVEEVSALAEQYAAVDGLVWKIWKQNLDKNRGGAVYLFKDQAALDAYLASDLAAMVAEHPALSDFSLRPYAVMGEETRLTRGPADLASGGTGGEGEVGPLLEVNLRYTGGTAAFMAAVAPLAEQFAQAEGLRWKIWAINEATSEFSGILYFADEASLQAFLDSELAATVTTHPAVSAMTVTPYTVMADVSALTYAPLR